MQMALQLLLSCSLMGDLREVIEVCTFQLGKNLGYCHRERDDNISCEKSLKDLEITTPRFSVPSEFGSILHSCSKRNRFFSGVAYH